MKRFCAVVAARRDLLWEKELQELHTEELHNTTERVSSKYCLISCEVYYHSIFVSVRTHLTIDTPTTQPPACHWLHAQPNQSPFSLDPLEYFHPTMEYFLYRTLYGQKILQRVVFDLNVPKWPHVDVPPFFHGPDFLRVKNGGSYGFYQRE